MQLKDILNSIHRSDVVFRENTSKTFFIYGTGMFAQEVQRVLQKHGFKLSGFLDHRNIHPQTINDLLIHLPNDPSISIEQRRGATVILGIHNREANITKIINSLKEFGFNNIASSIALYDHFAEELGTRYWLTSRTYYSSHTEEIQSVYELLSDEKSREIFESLICFRTTGDYSFLSEPDMEHQYFPQLSNYVIKNRERPPDTSLFPCGVYSSTIQLTFETGKGEASVASQTGTSTIQCVSLDECIPTFQPTLIKMDIEGSEMDALLDAQRLIKTITLPCNLCVSYPCTSLGNSIMDQPDCHGRQHPLHISLSRTYAQLLRDTIFCTILRKEQS